MSIVFEIKGKQYRYIPTKKEQIFRIDYQKDKKSGDEIIFDKILSHDEEFGQPYLKDIRLISKVIKHGKNPPIRGLKYQAKKHGSKKTWGHRRQYTEVGEVKIVYPQK